MSIDYRQVLKQYQDQGISVRLKDGNLSVKAAKGGISDEQKKFLKDNKEEIIAALMQEQIEYPLTDIQSAYYLGRMKGFSYGEVACQVCFEVEYDRLDPQRANEAIDKVIAKHEMLRAVITQNGTQKILKDVPKYKAPYNDFSDFRKDESVDLDSLRAEYSNWSSTIGQWPSFRIGITQFKDICILHIVMDFIIADWTSVFIFLREFEKFYFTPDVKDDKQGLTFFEYVKLEEKLKETKKYKDDMEFWKSKIDKFPESANLPVNSSYENTFTRKVFELPSDAWQAFTKKVQKLNLTPTVALLTVYEMCLERYSENKDFAINITMLNRMPLHEEVNKVIGDFTSVTLLESSEIKGETICRKMKRAGALLSENLDHNAYSGVQFMRELTKVRGKENTIYPYVFTSSLGLYTDDDCVGKIGSYGISQTPQVFIDCQAKDSKNGLRINWDIRNGIFRDEVIDGLFEMFTSCVNKLVYEENAFESDAEIAIPEKQFERRLKVNVVKENIKNKFLHSEFYRIAADSEKSQRTAVVDENGIYSYSQVSDLSRKIASKLLETGISAGELVGVLLDKGVYQTAAVMGILALGAGYVPLDVSQPQARLNYIAKKAKLKCILTQENCIGDWTKTPLIDTVSICKEKNKMIEFSDICYNNSDSIAYVIYTSGSTGQPKGVQITHESAMNTILDVNERFGIDENDCAIGLSKLNFDLSVYDIFGMLSCGGKVVYPKLSDYLNTKYWIQLCKDESVTVWNTVPSLYQMFLDEADKDFVRGKEAMNNMKCVLLSGDWVFVDAYNRTNKYNSETKVIALGGATEGSIWSNFHICDESDSKKDSVPYGIPLSNQQFRVRNSNGQDCPDYVVGELHILGYGVSAGYLDEDELNHNSFYSDSETALRAYKTGDYGYYQNNGEIIFAGRRDAQIKLHGHRIEIGEIESTIRKYSAVQDCFVTVDDNHKILIAGIVADEADLQDIKAFLQKQLPEYMIPQEIFMLQEMPYSTNGKKDRKVLLSMYKEHCDKAVQKSERKDSAENNALEKMLCTKISNQLGITSVDVNDHLYDKGADSLILARYVSEVLENLHQDKLYENLKFDDCLRSILSEPVVSSFARFIRSKAEENNISSENKEQKQQTNEKRYLGSFNVFGKKQDKELVRIVFHAGIGTSNFARYVLPLLEQQKLGTVYCATIDDMERYCQVDSDKLIDRLGEEYAAQIEELQFKRVQLIGYCMGGMIAAAAAKNLIDTDVEIESLLLVDSAPIQYDIEETIANELAFITNYFITIEDVYPDIKNEPLMNSILYVFHRNKSLKNSDFEILKENDETKDAYEMLCKLKQIPREKRMQDYAAAISAKLGKDILPQMLDNNYQVYIQSFLASRYDAPEYIGDVHFLEAKEELAFVFNIKEETVSYWEDRTIGEFTKDIIPGDHVSCIEDEKNAENVAYYAAADLNRED